MNLMFRKNFREQKSGAMPGKGTKSGAGRHANKRCTRDQGYTPIEEHHYRTHLFFSPPRCSYAPDDQDGSTATPEPRCGPMTGAGGEPLVPSSTISPAMTESDLPQPLVVRSPSVSLKWMPHHSPKPIPNRQVSFNRGRSPELAKTLSGLERDCFIIPVHSLDRFLPAGVPMPIHGGPHAGLVHGSSFHLQTAHPRGGSAFDENARALYRLHDIRLQSVRGRRQREAGTQLALLDRGEDDLQVPAESCRPAQDLAPQVAEPQGRQDVHLDLRTSQPAQRRNSLRAAPARAQSQADRLHGPVQAPADLLTFFITPVDLLSCRFTTSVMDPDVTFLFSLTSARFQKSFFFLQTRLDRVPDGHEAFASSNSHIFMRRMAIKTNYFC
ncbi:uncharacterized protein LOC132700313 isoform X3 [Cylas formicarius]|uniref:uncharacterized protein LOC132700313 isoform X3 n=1 Tax=Cylas formicarius TaxID=197179 RepID=UPI002958B7A4|nr:uncharacterized protein LOC132700313 isoform X3 [Cylas formicarius]